MTPTETLHLRFTLHEVVGLCDAAFVTHDGTVYARIERKLEGAPECAEVHDIRALCRAGPTLLSARFAYPHIASTARRFLARTAPAAPEAGA